MLGYLQAQINKGINTTKYSIYIFWQKNHDGELTSLLEQLEQKLL